MSNPTYIDLFAGAGGLSEGFNRAGYKPVAHVEMDTNACETIKTRLSYHFFKQKWENWFIQSVSVKRDNQGKAVLLSATIIT